ncbi:MAG: acetyl-CoA carboxylase biotin carboxyl carrier protein [Candidatus Omnitrophota bacterium]
MNLKEIKEMISLMNENNLTELELEREGLKIRLKRGGSSSLDASNIVVERMNMQELTQGSRAQIMSPTENSNQATTITDNFIEIKAPMVGTFYTAPSPDASPFVSVGSTLEIGQVVCIIEAMKLMNEIKSEVKGIVKEILIENADPIEFGQVLFKIEPL